MRIAARLSLAAALCIPIAVVAACTGNDAPSSLSNDSLAVTTTNAVADAGSAAERGAALVDQLGCHHCHDSQAGVMAGNAAGITRRVGTVVTKVYPANLTPDPDTGLGTADAGWSDEYLARAIRTGVDDQCLTLCKVMPKFDLADDDMASVIAYLRSLTPVHNPIANQGCPKVDPSVSGAGQFVDAGSCASN